MHLHSYRIANYRRLRDVHINLAEDISIFVGANNSGKTSATQAIHAFVAATSEKSHSTISVQHVGRNSTTSESCPPTQKNFRRSHRLASIYGLR
jgi:predicted ATP-dependent endonuclease of OLD family